MALTKKIWKISRYDKGVGNFNADGMFWWSQGLDFETTPPYIRVASKLLKEIDSATLTTFSDVRWGVTFESTVYLVNLLDGKFFKAAGYASWSEVHDNVNAWGGLGLFGDEDFLYYASNGWAGRVPKGWTLQTDWLDSWQSFNVSNNAELCPVTKFLKFICFGNVRFLAVWDTGASTWNATRVTLPPGYQMKWLLPLTDYLVISAHHNAYGSALFFWDGISQTYNRVLQLPQVKSLAGVVDKNVLYVITGDGWINRFDGVGLVKLNRFPDLELDANYASLINVNPDAVKVFQGTILIGKAASGFDFSKRFYPGGIWVYNPMTNALYFKHMMSHFAINNNSGFGVIAVGSVIIDQLGQMFRVAWYKGGGTGPYIIDNSMDSGDARPYDWGAYIVTSLLDDEPYRRKKFIQTILNFWKPLVDSSFARINIKYNTTEQYQRDSRYASGGTSTTFTLSFVPSYWEVGDEVTVLSGGGSGQIRHIASISGSTITVDETLYGGASYDSNSYLLLSKFKKIAVIKGNDNKEAVNKFLKFTARSKKIQLKIEIWSPSGFIGEWDLGLADISTVYIPDRIIK